MCFPLGISIIFLKVAIMAGFSNWEILFLFNKFGEAYIDLFCLFVSVVFSIYIIYNIIRGDSVEHKTVSSDT
jgi:hypothetical protein